MTTTKNPTSFSSGSVTKKDVKKHNTKKIFFIFFALLLISSTFIIVYKNKNIDQQEDKFNGYKDMFDGYEKDTNKEFYFFGFHNDLVSTLNRFYKESGGSEGKEFGVCLKGYILDGNKVYINNYSRLRLSDMDNNSVLSDYCNREGELGFLHKHPSNNPMPSLGYHEDLYHFFKGFKYHNNKLAVIMYDYDKFEIFTEKNWQYKLNFENCEGCQEELIKMWEEI